MKSNYIVRATKFMESFYPYMRKYRIDLAVNRFNEEHHRVVRLCSGSVRHVLVTSDYVVKWNYHNGNSKCFGGCHEEYLRYQQIKNGEYSYLFAVITPIRVKGRIFYVMPRISRLAEEDEYIEDVLNSEELEYIFDILGIGDIHNENWGYLHNQPIIIDYACGNLE